VTPDSIPEANSEDGLCFCKLNAFTASRCWTVCVHLVIIGPTAVHVAIDVVQFERICFPIALHCWSYIIMACTPTAQPCLDHLTALPTALPTDLPRSTRTNRIHTVQPSVVVENNGGDCRKWYFLGRATLDPTFDMP
jgi:hypothetical protein